MSIIFYDHLVNKLEIIQYIELLDEPDNQKGKVKQLVDDIIHQGIVDYILQNLEPPHHKTFLSQLTEKPYDPELLTYLKDKTGKDIENEIRKVAEDLIVQVKKDLGIPKKGN